MVSSCTYCGSKQGIEGRTHHKFPLKDKEILQLWLQNMNLGSKFVPKNHSLLCSDHFEKKCFQEGTNKKCLRIGSIPTLFGEYKSVCVYCHAVKGHDKKRSFRKFPLHNSELLEKWVAAMKLKDFIPNEKSLLCSDHFDEKCLRSSGRGLILKANAVPNLFSSLDGEVCENLLLI
nr:PREDICTED: THAP domain-containing protein 5-like [Linepithema humile]